MATAMEAVVDIIGILKNKTIPFSNLMIYDKLFFCNMITRSYIITLLYVNTCCVVSNNKITLEIIEMHGFMCFIFLYFIIVSMELSYLQRFISMICTTW